MSWSSIGTCWPSEIRCGIWAICFAQIGAWPKTNVARSWRAMAPELHKLVCDGMRPHGQPSGIYGICSNSPEASTVFTGPAATNRCQRQISSMPAPKFGARPVSVNGLDGLLDEEGFAFHRDDDRGGESARIDASSSSEGAIRRWHVVPARPDRVVSVAGTAREAPETPTSRAVARVPALRSPRLRSRGSR